MFARMNLFLKIISGFGFILLLFFLVIIIYRGLSNEVASNSQWVTVSEQIIKNSNRLQRNIIDMESGLRGFLLTGEEDVLKPYIEAKIELPGLFLESQKLLKNTAQKKELQEIFKLQKEWQNFADIIIEAKKNADESEGKEIAFLRLYKTEMKNRIGYNISADIRAKFREFNSLEYSLREQRRAELNDLVKKTQFISTLLIILSLLIGISLAYFIARYISGRVSKMVVLSEKIAAGDFSNAIRVDSNDELGQLASALNVMASKLNESFSQLKRKNKELDQFAYVVSHDLKAPLRGIDNISSWIKEDMGKGNMDKVPSYLDMMTGRVKRLENLINGILDLARVGKIKREITQVNLNTLVKETFDLINSSPSNILIAQSLPTFYTQRTYLEQIFSNLISNAIKYSDKEICKIEISFKDMGSSYDFAVKDNGPGIEKEYHEKIFIIFQTLKERDAFESTGVGLAIVKKIIDQVKGNIYVESELGHGSTFHFTWPKEFKQIEI